MSRLQPSLRRVALAVVLLAAGAAARGAGLAEAWAAARRFDAQYQAAGHELEAQRQNVPLTRSALLPNAALQASTSKTTGWREFQGATNQDVRLPLDYSSPQASLQMRVPLFNYDALMRYRQTRVQVLGAEAVYELRGIDLADRVGSAYLQALLAHENVGLVEAEIAAFESHLSRAQQRQLRGEGTRTEVAQTQASVDVARARLLEASDQLELARRVLRRLTGLDLLALKTLPSDLVPPPLAAQTLQEWLDRAERHSPALESRRRNVEVARLGIDRAKAGHLPRLDLVGSISRLSNESISSLNQNSSLRSVGVQLNVPLYSGGAVEAGVAQARAETARSEEELRNERETLQAEVQRQYAFAAGSPARVAAYRRALASSDVALEGAQRSLAAGFATNTEVLDAQARRFTALRDLAQARYEGLAARMRLQLQAGTPAAEVVADIDRLLTQDLLLKTRTQP